MMTKTHQDPQVRESALEWFFGLNEGEKEDLKGIHFPNVFIAYDSKWGYHYTFEQIEEMYIKTTTPDRLG